MPTDTARSGNHTDWTGSLTDNTCTDLPGSKKGSRMQPPQTSAPLRLSGGGGTDPRASFSDSLISDLHDSAPSLQGPNNSNSNASARPLRLGQSLASFSEWGSDSGGLVDASSSSTLMGMGDGSGGGGGLRTSQQHSVRSIAGAAQRASTRSQSKRSSLHT